MFQGRTVYFDKAGAQIDNHLLEEFFVLHEHIVKPIPYTFNEHEFPTGKFLLICSFDSLCKIKDKESWMQRLRATDGMVYANEHSDGHYLYREQCMWINDNPEQIKVHAEVLYNDARPQCITNLPAFSHNFLPHLLSPRPYEPVKDPRDFICFALFKSDDSPYTKPRELIKHQIDKHNLSGKGYVRFGGQIFMGHEGKTQEEIIGGSGGKLDVPWDLYANANFEIVPESLWQDATIITEKTIKPIVGGVPFLTLGGVNWYRDFHRQGFVTFEDVIDEAWAYHPDIEKRVAGAIDSVLDILDMGSAEFRKKCKAQIDHNRDWYYTWVHKSKQQYFDKLVSFFL